MGYEEFIPSDSALSPTWSVLSQSLPRNAVIIVTGGELELQLDKAGSFGLGVTLSGL